MKRKMIKLTSLLILAIVGVFLSVVVFQKVSALFEKQPAIVLPKEDFSVEHFIHEIGEIARDLAAENDLYGSVMIAQALLESNKGKSGLASEPNYNLFGIKGEYKKQSVLLETQEDDGKGNMETIEAKFRQYPSYEASLEDYVKLLSEGVSWDEAFYHDVKKSKTKNYKEATKFLTGTYATDSRYEEKLNDLIEQYDLTKYDHPIKDAKEIEIADSDVVVDEIAKAHQVSKTSLIQWNKLSSSFLEKGQKIQIYELAGD